MQGYNPNWSGLLQAGQNQGQVMGQLGQAAGGLIKQGIDNRQQTATQQEAVELFKTGTPDQIAEFSLKNPQMGKLLDQQIGYKSAATKENQLQGMRDIIANPANTEQILMNRAQMVQDAGGDPSGVMQQLQEFKKDPEAFNKTVRNVYAFKDPEGSMAYSKATGEQQAKPMSEYQAAMVEGKKVDQDLRRTELETKKLESQFKREGDQLKRDELETKITANKQKVAKAQEGVKQAATDAWQSSNDTLKLINEIETHPGFTDYVGAKGASSLFGLKDEPMAGSDAAGVAGMIETLSSQNFMNSIQQMKGMGALSDAEGKKVAAAVSSLNPNMSEAAFKKSLNVIKNITKRGMAKSRKLMGDKGVDVSKPKVDTPSQNSGGNFSSLWGG